MLKLHIGSGLNYKKDYVNIDAFDSTVADVIAPAWNLDYQDDVVDIIESYHLIEHLGYINTLVSLGEWIRVLKPMSSVVLETPDIDKTFELYLKTSDHSQKATILNWIFGDPVKGQDHKYCMSSGMLRKLLIESGYEDIMERFHEKTFGVPSYTMIAKKPLRLNPNFLLVNKLRKRCFYELGFFNSEQKENYRLDFEKQALGLKMDYAPRDFSNITFNELFTNCAVYNIDIALILIEECKKLNIIDQNFFEQLFEKLEYLKSLGFTRYLYHTLENNMLSQQNPEQSCLIVQETGKNLIKLTLFETNLEEFKKTISQNIPTEIPENFFKSDYFSMFFIETTISRTFAKVMKGNASEEELNLYKAIISMD